MFDKQAYKKQSFEEADNLKEYWKTKTMDERLAAAVEMIKAAYGIVGQPFKGIDKTYYTKRKRKKRELDEVTVRIISYDDLLVAKKSVGRHKDLNDLEHL